MRLVIAAAVAGLVALPPAVAQQAATPRPVPSNQDAIRQDAAQIAKERALLADPDPNVRLLALREYARSADPIQSQIAIEAGLSSAELAMQEVALRAVLAGTRQIVIELKEGGCQHASSAVSSFNLPLTAFDPASGTVTERSWQGQLSGGTFTFVAGHRSGSLLFDSDAREFRGTVNLNGGRAGCAQNASWRPR